MVPFSYGVRNLLVRKTTTLATAMGIALVVFVFSSVLMLANGVEHTLGRSGSADVAIVMRDGSDAELSSSVELSAAGLVLASPEVRQRPNGRPDGVGEIITVLALDKLGENGVSNVQVRGVPDDVYQFRPTVHIVAGRAARPGSDECVVGTAIRGRFRGLDIGQSFELRKNRMVRVVGVTEDAGSSFESEVWVDVDNLRSAFGREGLVSSVRVRLRSAEAFEGFRRSLESNRQLGVDVHRETKYYEDQSSGTAKFIRAIGILVAFFFSIGAMIGATITMHASIANRSREIGTLRALGFSRFSILVSFLTESVVLAVGGGIIGAVGSLGMGFVRLGIVNFASWSEIVFRFTPTPKIIVGSMVFAAAMGLFGGLLPAVRAARLSVLDALRG